MWAWLVVPVLARVLMASKEADSFDPIRSLHVDIEADAPVSSVREIGWKWDQHLPINENASPYENSISSFIKDLSSSRPENPEEKKNKRSRFKENRDWDLDNKVLRSQNRQGPWQEIKKSRAFSPWGGKRVAVYGPGAKVRRPIRVPFNSWGGKRSYPRVVYSGWGQEENENGVGKRTKFNAWGGKRSKNNEPNDEEMKRTRFNAWGGKRNYENYVRSPAEMEEKKSIFNPWGGKRSYTRSEAGSGDQWEGEAGDMFQLDKPGAGPERVVGGGVNCAEDIEQGEDENEIPTAESEIIELRKKKASDFGHETRRDRFNPWGGK